MKHEARGWTGFMCALALAAGLGAHAQVKEQDQACIGCHAAAAGQKVVHSAVHMGCSTCHAELDAASVPHVSRGSTPHGLSAQGPALCANCHDGALFAGSVVHAPVAAGQCLGCHDPHTSANAGLLKKQPARLCLDCHSEVGKGPHVVAGFTRSGHPLGAENREVVDPLRPGKPFYCAACHEPHRSRWARLARFPEKGMAACQKCHQK